MAPAPHPFRACFMIRGETPGFHLLPAGGAGGLFIPAGGAVSACRGAPLLPGGPGAQDGWGTRRARQGRRDQARPARGMEERMRRGWGRGWRGAGRGWGGDRGRSVSGTGEPGLSRVQPAQSSPPFLACSPRPPPPPPPTEVFISVIGVGFQVRFLS